MLDQQLQAFCETDLQTYLNHVYLSCELGSATAADALRVADLFEASKLMEKVVTDLEENTADSMFATPDHVLRWLLLAERFKLPSFLKKCANHAAIQYNDICTNQRFHQLQTSALKAILRGVHLLTQLHAGLTQEEPQPCVASLYTVQSVSVSATNIIQTYSCKISHEEIDEGGYETVTHERNGHQGSWSWNLQRHMWQLDSKATVTTKVLPGNVLELADLIGSPPCCTGARPSKSARVSDGDDCNYGTLSW